MERQSPGSYKHGDYTVWRQDNRYMRMSYGDNWNVNYKGRFVKAFDTLKDARKWLERADNPAS
jgi:hypothetical protein